MRGSPATDGASTMSLPSTPLFPPLVQAGSQSPKAEIEKEARGGQRTSQQVKEQIKSEAQVGGGAPLPLAEFQRQNKVQRQMVQDGGGPATLSKAGAEDELAAKVTQRRAPALQFEPVAMPTSLLRPLDQEKERKALLLEQRFRKERMAVLRKQNELRRRRHAAKEQQLRDTAARERAAALENRHRKLHAARVLMERGLAAAASGAEPAAAVDRREGESGALPSARGDSCAPSATGVCSTPANLPSPSARREPRARSVAGARARSRRRSPKTLSSCSTSDSLSVCHVASTGSASRNNAEQLIPHKRCAPASEHRSSSGIAADLRSKDPNDSRVTPPTSADALTENVFVGAARAQYRRFPELSTIAECFVAGAAMECESAVSGAGPSGAAAAGRYHYKATQKILSLWPQEARMLLNAAITNRERLFLLQNQDADRLLMAASISSHQTAEQACRNTRISVAQDRRSSLAKHPVNNTQKLPYSTLALADAPASNYSRVAPGTSHLWSPAASTPRTQGHQPRQQYVQQRMLDQRPDGLLQQQTYVKSLQQQPQRPGHTLVTQQHRRSALQQLLPPHPGQMCQRVRLRVEPADDLHKCCGPHAEKSCLRVEQPGRPGCALSPSSQMQPWDAQDCAFPAMRGIPETIHPVTQPEEPNESQDIDKRPASRATPQDCGACHSSLPGGESAAPARLPDPPRPLPQRQPKRHEAEQQQPQPQGSRLELQHRSQNARVSNATRKKSYAYQFAHSSRARTEETHQRRRKCSWGGRKPGLSAVQGPLSSRESKGGPTCVDTSANCAAGGRIRPSAAASNTDNTSAHTALPLPSSAVAATRPPMASIEAPFPSFRPATPSTSLTGSATAAADALQGGAAEQHVRSNTFQEHVPACSSTGEPTIPAQPPATVVAQHQQQHLQQHLQPDYSCNEQKEKLPTLQHLLQEDDESSDRKSTGVQVVNRKLKALIEEQLKYATTHPANACAPTGVAPCLARSSTSGTEGAQGVDSELTLTLPSIGETVDAVGATAVSQPAHDRLNLDSTAAVRRDVYPRETNDFRKQTLETQHDSDYDVSTWPQPHHGQNRNSCVHPSLSEVPRIREDPVQKHAYDQQYHQEQCAPPERSSGGAEADCHSLPPVREDNGALPQVDVYDDGKPLATPGKCIAVEEVHKKVAAETCKPPKADGGYLLRMIEKGAFLHDESEVVCSPEKRRGHLQTASQNNTSAHHMEKMDSHSIRPSERMSEALSAEEHRSSRKREQDAGSALPPRECACRQHKLRSGTQREERRKRLVNHPSTYNESCTRIIRVRARATTYVTNEQGGHEDTPIAGCAPSELPGGPRTNEVHAGRSATTVADEHSEREKDHEAEQKREAPRIHREKPGPARDRGCDIQGLDDSMSLEDEALLPKSTTEAGCSKRWKSCSMEPLAGSRSRSSSCTPSQSEDRGQARRSLNNSHTCTTCCGHATGGSAVTDGQSFARPPGDCGSGGQADNASDGPHRCSTCPMSRTVVLAKASSKCVGNRKPCGVRTCRSSSDCCVACSPLAASRKEQVNRATAVGRMKVQSQPRRSTLSRSSPNASQENQQACLRPAASRGILKQQLDCSITSNAFDVSEQTDADSDSDEIHDTRHSSTHSASLSTLCSRASVSGDCRRQLKRDEGDAAAQDVKAKQCPDCCVKEAFLERVSVPQENGRTSTPNCTDGRRNTVASNNAIDYESSDNCSDRSTRPNTGVLGRRSRRDSEIKSDTFEKRCGSEQSQSNAHPKATSLCQTRHGKPLSTVRTEDRCCCCCASFSMHLPATPADRSRRAWTQTSTSVTGAKADTTCAGQCAGSSECRWLSREASKSNSSSTCCDSSTDSLDNGTLCRALSRRTSSMMPASAPLAKSSRVLSKASVCRKAAPKKCDAKELKLQALTDAERKVEERLLLLDVNQKTLDEQHERRKYLQQHQLQQQQLLLLEQQQHLQHQQQLLALAQYGRFPQDDDTLNPFTALHSGSGPSALDSTLACSANNDSLTKGTGTEAAHPPAAKVGRAHTTDSQKRIQCRRASTSGNFAGTSCTPHSGAHRMSVPLPAAAPASFLTYSPLAASLFVPSTSRKTTTCTQPAPACSKGESLLYTAASVTHSLPSQTCQPTGAENEPGLLSAGGLHPQPLRPRMSVSSAGTFPPLRSRPLCEPAPSASAVVTRVAGRAEDPSISCTPRTPVGVRKTLPPTRRAVAGALPPLRARTSSWTRR